MLKNKVFMGLLWMFAFQGCKKESSALFQKLKPGDTGIEFNNFIEDKPGLNILDFNYVYNGGGVAIGDVNNDGFQDIFFTGNMVPNKLYLNTGGLRFKDVSEDAGITAGNKWSSGVTMVDLNHDGLLDIYVCATTLWKAEDRANMLFINKGMDKNGIPSFVESAKAYNIADTTHSVHAAFFDYDRDGDLDLYVLTNEMESRSPNTYRPKITDGRSPNVDRLYRNEGIGSTGHPVFKFVSEEAGIQTEGYGLGLAISDFNYDGWPDIYIANDYLSNDLLYINNRNGTFTNRIDEYFKHQSFSAMGNDIADINNDGLPDVITLDMLPRTNIRKKRMIQANNYNYYFNNEKYGYEYQYIRNTLQLNNGITTDGKIIPYSEIGVFANIHNTDWSWAPLLADFDNDGFRDLFITNGFPKDVTDQDFISFYVQGRGMHISKEDLLQRVPEVKISNMIFNNNGNLTFSDKTNEWGLNDPSYSNGAAYGDLDNDGDLDLVVNNINDFSFVFENNLYNEKNDSSNHYLRIELVGPEGNKIGPGTQVKLFYQEKQQYAYQYLHRGYQSNMENIMHFGLGKVDQVDSLVITWPDDKKQKLFNIAADQVLEINYADASSLITGEMHKRKLELSIQAVFNEVSSKYGLNYLHFEPDFIDFNIQNLLPHKFSQNGPALAVGDLDGNGLDDLFISGSNRNSPIIYFQQNGYFKKSEMTASDLIDPENQGALIFDADGDGKNDIYISNGGSEFTPGSKFHRDKFFINQGNGNFEQVDHLIPEHIVSSTSVVRSSDFDLDGDLDLFIGGRLIPGKYPYPASSYILRNDSKPGNPEFTDVTSDIAGDLVDLGLVHDALWTDFNNDNYPDLILAGEWMPLTFLKNEKGVFTNVTSGTGLGEKTGWWNSLAPGDFDNDGDTDYLAGNLGLNTPLKASQEKPLSIYAGDFDENGKFEAILVNYQMTESDTLAPFPFHSRDDLLKQVKSFEQKILTYEDYGKVTIEDLLNQEQLNSAIKLKAAWMKSSYIENLGPDSSGNIKFKMSELTAEAQFAPVYGMLPVDFNEDGNLDVLAIGNSYATEVFIGRYDALNGLVLKGNGSGSFEIIKNSKSNFLVTGDAKALVELQTPGERLFIASQNQDSLRVFSTVNTKSQKKVKLNDLDSWAYLTFKDGRKRKEEFYYGSGYLSQSGRYLHVPDQVVQVEIFDFNGKKRTLNFNFNN